MLCRQNHRHGDKAALGKYHIRLIAAQQPQSLGVSLQYPEGVGEILNIQIAAQLAGRDAVIGNAGVLNQPPLDALIRADIAYFVIQSF